MPSESIPEDERLALARALRHVSEEDTPERTPENQEEIARLFGDEAEATQEEAVKEEGEGKPKFRLLHVLIGLLVLACLALVVPLAMDFLGGDDSGEVPVIQAEQQPDKVRPDEPGGLQVPHQDLQVLNQGAEEGAAEPVERLLPPPETPEPLAPTSEDVLSPGTAPGALTEVAPTEAPASPAAEDTTASSVAPSTGDLPASEPAAPAEVAEVPAAPTAESTAGSGASQAPAATTPAPAAPASEAPTPAAPAPVEAATPEPKAVEPAAPAEPAKPAESQQAALPPKAEPAPAAAGGGIYIQLGSLTNRDGVPKEWARLQKVFPDFLGDMELAIQTVTLEGRGTFHRIQAGPLPNRGTAEELCAFLKDAKQACIVVKR